MIELSDQARHKATGPLLALHQASPQAIVAAIVRTEGEAGPRQAELEATGLTVRRVFRLVPSLAVQGEVARLLALAERPWVRSISLDQEVHTMPGSPANQAEDPSGVSRSE
jgi:hypothetical protein